MILSQNQVIQYYASNNTTNNITSNNDDNDNDPHQNQNPLAAALRPAKQVGQQGRDGYACVYATHVYKQILLIITIAIIIHIIYNVMYTIM